MNIYEIALKKYDYDEYDGWVVIADNEEEVKQICNIKKQKNETERCSENQYEDNIEYIKLIGIANNDQEKGIVLGSFNAG